MIVPVMAISNLVLTQQIYSEETNGVHAHYREPVPLSTLVVKTKMDIHVDVLVQFYPWFKFYFPLCWDMVIYDNEFETRK